MQTIADDTRLDAVSAERGVVARSADRRSSCIMRTAKIRSPYFQSDELADATFAAAAPLPGAVRRTEER